MHSDQVYQIINCLEFQSSDTKFIIVESNESYPNLVRHLTEENATCSMGLAAEHQVENKILDPVFPWYEKNYS